MAVEVIRSSTLSADPDEVWEAISTLHGVNRELRPFVVMREPAVMRGRTLVSLPPGERVSCLMLAGGVLPFDRHLLCLESVTPGGGFAEESTSWLQRRWRHVRTLEAVDGGTRITDHVTAEPRVVLLAPMVRRIVDALFAHRHRRLTKWFDRSAELRPLDGDPTEITGGGVRASMDEEDLSFIDRAPVRAEATRDIAATPEQIWAVLVDHRRWPEWFGPSLERCEPTSTAESGVDSTRMVRLRGGAQLTERFIVWDEPSEWAFTGTAGRPKVFEALVERVALEPLGAGGCRVTYTMAFRPSRVLRPLAPLLTRGISRTLGGSLEGLANRAEERTAH